MASKLFIKCVQNQISGILSNKGRTMLAPSSVRFAAYWNKDFKPAPYPKSKEEEDAAAKKYNMLPEEYRPYADDGYGYGDYPKLPGGLGIESRDNFYPYDNPEHKRNYHEVVHADIDLYGEDRYSQPDKLRYTMTYYVSCFVGVMTFCFVLYYWLDDKKMFRPVLPKQYPRDGSTHYTFALKEC